MPLSEPYRLPAVLITSLHSLAHLLAATRNGVVPEPKITYSQSIVLGILQGISELFPISSLGHTVIFPALFGWHNLVASESKPESFWLGYVVALHVGTALALVAFFWRDWVAIVAGLLHSIRTAPSRRRTSASDGCLSWRRSPRA